MKFSALIITIVPGLVSGWHLQLYKDELYKNVIVDRSGTVGQPCKDLSNPNAASSMHWDNGALGCNVLLYNGYSCEGDLLGDAKYRDWHLPRFSSAANDKVNSYKINC
ncbi:hypothetical protein B0J11DRAFT_612332 [Dendryphion nanum]|uniref:Uncharacterized protein n=1 Tax=Dendryphion nanum TaxID=256645 RepID=A0A9P9E7G9_9PLEO|nr:hypothetical protein B0J11DRAFT_612332 [Dendryphion nanum]